MSNTKGAKNGDGGSMRRIKMEIPLEPTGQVRMRSHPKSQWVYKPKLQQRRESQLLYFIIQARLGSDDYLKFEALAMEIFSKKGTCRVGRGACGYRRAAGSTH